jgi:hypothetical protein
MSALTDRLKAHAANLAASWNNDTGWGDDEDGADIFLFQAEGFVLVIYAVEQTGWGWRVSDEQSGFEYARSEKHHPIDEVMPEAWRAFARLIRRLNTDKGRIP